MTAPGAETRTDNPSGGRFLFRARHRLSGRRTYAAVHRGGVRKPRGPLVVVGLPNQTGESRLGLSVGRRVGDAVTRNRIKRRIREAFRLMRPDMPPGYDLVVIVRPHTPATLDEYRGWLSGAWEAIDHAWRKRLNTGADS